MTLPENQLRHFVIGADGLIGGALVNQLGVFGARVKGTTRRNNELSDKYYLDLNQPLNLADMVHETDVVYLCAGNASISQCEANKNETRKINVEALTKIITELLKHGIFIIFLSTDMVFDGTHPFPNVKDKPNPVNEYAKQKMEVEEFLKPYLERVAIVRLSKVLFTDYPLFKNWLRSLRNGVQIAPFADKRIAPIFIDYAIRVLIRIGAQRENGIWHLSACDDLSYAQAIHYLSAKFRLPVELIQPVESQEEKIPGQRTQMALNCERIEKLGFTVQHSREALDQCFVSSFMP
jgi:dTDP-4-dehydrorhamnose reductase